MLFSEEEKKKKSQINLDIFLIVKNVQILPVRIVEFM